MQLGAIFPQTEIGNDPAVIRGWAQAVEAIGYQHILSYDHVLGASTATRPDWDGPYTSDTAFHEPFVLYGFLAAVTQHVELVTGVLILPQRQTALVAKQAAEVDVLSGGRLRLGIGVGWNAVEYEGLNEDFATRGARSAEQIAVLRALWSATDITFAGRWHHLNAAGIKPLPVQRPIPIWIGGDADAVLRRTGQLGDGWFPQRPPDATAQTLLARLRAYTRAAGRDERAVGIEARLHLSRNSEAGWAAYARGWRDLGATHLSVNTMDVGFTTPEQHLEALRRAYHTLTAAL